MVPSRDASELVRELVARCLGFLEDGDLAAVAGLLEEHPDVAAVVNARLMKLRAMGFVDTPKSAQDFPERLGEFHLLRRLGGGGMGVVFLAEQPSLKRQVALKVLRHEHLFFPQSRERFRREVELVSALHHPGIVPVYAVGEDEGVPYFTMEWVRGCTLNEVLRTLQGKDPRLLRGRDLLDAIRSITGEAEDPALPALYQGSWADACLRIVQQVADALQHVHEHGILHRDLKPSNVMVTKTGRVQLLDFGLASPQDGSRITRTGVLTGSIPYLAPELLDATHKPDERTDLYALGVTFYELLTLECPFLAPSGEETRRRILEARPRAPRRLNQRISWELETACLVAMERDATRRYASVRAFALDLENVRRGHPLHARRPTPWLRVRRWAGRHPSAMVGITCAFVLLGAFALVYASVERATRRAVDEQRTRALANLGDARLAVERMLERVSEGVLAHTPYMEETRRALLADALEFHHAFLERHADVPELAADAAETWLSMARIRRSLGETQAADEAFARCDALFTALRDRVGQVPAHGLHHARGLVEHGALVLEEQLDLERALGRFDEALALLDRLPSSDAQRLERAHALSMRGETHRQRLDLAAAERDAAAAIALFDPPWPSSSSDARALHERVHRNRARVLLDLHRNAEAIQVLEGARNAHELFVQLDPTLDDRARLARLEQELAEVLVQNRNFEGAEATCLRTIERQSALVAEHPRVPAFRKSLAVAHATLARAHVANGRHAEAEAAHRETLRILGELHAEFEERGTWLHDLANAQRDLAFFLESRSRHEEGSRAIAKALALFDDLARRHPDAPAHRLDHVDVLNQWAVKQHVEGRAAEAERSYLDALGMCEAIEREHPGLPRCSWTIANLNRNLGILLADSAPQRAEAYYERANGLQRSLVERFPEQISHREGLAHGLTSIGILWEDRGDYDRAEQAYREALDLRREVLARTDEPPDAIAEVGGAEHNLASVLERRGRPEEALAGLERAIAMQQRALAINDRHPWYRNYLRTSSKLRVEILLDLRRPQDALEAARRYRETMPEDPGTQRMAAEYHARIAELFAAALVQDEERERAVAEAERTALDALAEAHRLGYRRRPDLRDASFWSRLESSARFLALREAIEDADD